MSAQKFARFPGTVFPFPTFLGGKVRCMPRSMCVHTDSRQASTQSHNLQYPLFNKLQILRYKNQHILQWVQVQQRIPKLFICNSLMRQQCHSEMVIHVVPRQITILPRHFNLIFINFTRVAKQREYRCIYSLKIVYKLDNQSKEFNCKGPAFLNKKIIILIGSYFNAIL